MQACNLLFEHLPFADLGDEVMGLQGVMPIPSRRTSPKPAKKRRSHNKERASYWQRLPSEIWAEIFMKCLSLKRDQRPVRKKPPFLLTQVCRAWYRITVNTPRLWSTVVLTTSDQSPIHEPDLCSGARFFVMCITRSKGAPIELHIRAEFLSHNITFDHILRISTQISHLTIIFPHKPSDFEDDERPFYFSPNDHLSMPNLKEFEVYNREKHITISASDTSQMEHIIRSSECLKSCVFCSRLPAVNGPLILANTANLEILSLEELVPLSTCIFLLQNIPTLRELSLLKVVVNPEQGPNYGNQVLKTMLNSPDITRPFTHSRLKCFALAYCKGEPSLFFKLATLPSLRYLVVDLRGDEKFSWPHQDFMSFLRRSHCKLDSFTIIDQSILPSQLLEILQSANVGSTIDSLSIQNYRVEDCVLDDSTLEKLTVRADIAEQSQLPSAQESTHWHLPQIICPKLEDLALFLPLSTLSIPKLVGMLKSRARRPGDQHYREHWFNTLRRVQMDLDEEMKPYLGDLRRDGLILRLYEQDQYDPSPIGMRQLRMLRQYLNGRGRSVVFEHDTGKWDGLLLDE